MDEIRNESKSLFDSKVSSLILNVLKQTVAPVPVISVSYLY